MTTPNQEILSHGSSWLSGQWSGWIAERVHERENVFAADPDELVAAYRREITYTSDYHGRELLELLQNADDAGANSPAPNQAIILLEEDGLCVGNTGTTFSAAGVKSLMVSDASPKQLDRSRYIGNRGLGFRAILNWTDHPFILSGDLAVGFDRNHARLWLAQLCEKHPHIKAKVEQMDAAGVSPSPVPMLAAPIFLVEGQVQPVNPSETWGFSSLWRRAQGLRSAGYDTVIAIPFTSDKAQAEVAEQLKHIGRDVLLFTKHLGTLEIQRPGDTVRWQVERGDDLIEITCDRRMRELWQLFTSVGRIPENYLRPDQRATPAFEVKLAVPRDGASWPGFLYNYFPTKVRFPYPLIAHATMELTNNRQNIVESELNKFLVRQLAELMAQAAEECQDAGDPWQPLSLIAPAGTLDPVLDGMGFRKVLLEGARLRRIVPTRANTFVVPAEALRLEKDTGSWLPDAGFEDVALWPGKTHLDKALKDLGLSVLSQADLRERLDAISQALSIEERVRLIRGLVNTGLMPTDPAPAILIDASGDVIPARKRVFLPPADGVSLEMTPWMDLTMLSGDLFAQLRSAFGGATARDLVSKLSAFRLHEYALVNLAAAIDAQATAQARTDSEHTDIFRRDALRTIFELYLRGGEGSLPARPETLKVKLLTRTGKYAAADTLYFGREYSLGDLTELLYTKIWPDGIVAGPNELRLDADDRQLGAFLSWLGVAAKPRTIHLDDTTEFTQYVKEHLHYPVIFDPDIRAESAAGIRWAKLQSVTSVERLNEILKDGDPYAILAWVATDLNVESWRSQGDVEAILEGVPPGMRSARRMRNHRIPSYVIWKLEQTAWLPTSNGGKRPPNQCVLAATLSDELRPILPQPDISNHEIFEQLGIDRRARLAALTRAGVNSALGELSWDDFYTLLLELPHHDFEGRSARSLYRALISRPDDGTAPSGPKVEQFREQGQLWGKCGDKGRYFAVNELLYVDNAILPTLIRKEIPLLDLDRRRGAQKVKRLFNVAPFDGSTVTINIARHEPSPRSSELASELDQLKPFITALRLHTDADASRINRLVPLEIHLCRWAQGNAVVGDRDVPIVLNASGEVMLDDEHAYVIAEPDEGQRLLADALIASVVGDIFATVLGVERGSDFALLASCVPDRRVELLAQLISGDRPEAEALLQQAQARLNLIDINVNEDETPVQGRGYVPSADLGDTNRNTAPHPGTREPEPDQEPHGAESDVKGQGDRQAKPGPVGAVEVKAIEHQPKGPARIIAWRVSRTPVGSGGPRIVHRVTDGSRCEEVAMRFEQAQGRFPVLAAHLQGVRAPGCDILSFTSDGDRNQFEEQHDWSLVARFIEVKGRSHERGSVELRGNELAAAIQNGDRYYLYRVYEQRAGEFEVAVLMNPAAASRRVIYEVDMFRDPTTERWSVSQVPGEAVDNEQEDVVGSPTL